MKKETKQPKEKKVQTTVKVAAIETKVSFKATRNGFGLRGFDTEEVSSKVSLETASESGMPASAVFNNTDELRRALDYFDEIRKENRAKLNTVIDFQEVEAKDE